MKKGTKKSSTKRSRKSSTKKSGTSKSSVDNMKYEIARDMGLNSRESSSNSMNNRCSRESNR